MRISIYIMIIIVFFSCTKDRKMYDEQNYNAVNSNITITQTTTDVLSLSDSLMHSTEDSVLFQGVFFDKVFAGDSVWMTLDFGDTTNTDADGKKREGTILIVYPLTYQSEGTQFSLQFENYGVNGVMYNGKMLVKYVTTQNAFRLFEVHAQHLSHVIFGQTGIVTLNVELRTRGLNNSAWMKGEMNCVGELDYNSLIVDSIYHDPLSKCFEVGKCSVTHDNFSALIHYGDGQQDKLATATSDLFRYIIDLKSL